MDASLPFDHIVVVMMENHSFDNLLGALHRSGQPKAHGLRFNGKGVARNWNPDAAGERVLLVPAPHHRAGAVGDADLERDAPADRRRPHGRLRAVGRKRRADGLLDRGRAALLLLVRAHVHDRQQVVHLGPVPDLSRTAAS